MEPSTSLDITDIGSCLVELHLFNTGSLSNSLCLVSLHFDLTCSDLHESAARFCPKSNHSCPWLSQHVTTHYNTMKHRATPCFFVAKSQRVAAQVVSLQGLVLSWNNRKQQWIPPKFHGNPHSFTVLHRASPCFTAADDSLAAMAVVPQGGPGGPPAPAGCEVRAANPPKGFGLFACAPCPAYSNLFTEDSFGRVFSRTTP